LPHTGAIMSSPVDAGFPVRRVRRVLPVVGLPFANRPSFATALRQRGLLARAIQPAGIDHARSTIADSWIAVAAICEAHRNREAMEQVLAVQRGDAVAA
jgi:hypothetical protein